MRNTKVAKPAYAVNERLGGLTVVEYVGFLPNNADLRNEHIYLVRCACKNVERKTQNYLQRVTSKLMCTKCTDALKKTHIVKPARKEVTNNKAINLSWPVIGDIT